MEFSCVWKFKEESLRNIQNCMSENTWNIMKHTAIQIMPNQWFKFERLIIKDFTSCRSNVAKRSVLVVVMYDASKKYLSNAFCKAPYQQIITPFWVDNSYSPIKFPFQPPKKPPCLRFVPPTCLRCRRTPRPRNQPPALRPAWPRNPPPTPPQALRPAPRPKPRRRKLRSPKKLQVLLSAPWELTASLERIWEWYATKINSEIMKTIEILFILFWVYTTVAGHFAMMEYGVVLVQAVGIYSRSFWIATVWWQSWAYKICKQW